MALDDAGRTIRGINETTAMNADPEQPTRSHRGGLRRANGMDIHCTGGLKTLRIGISNFPPTWWSV
jgi:hypothetical protein